MQKFMEPELIGLVLDMSDKGVQDIILVLVEFKKIKCGENVLFMAQFFF